MQGVKPVSARKAFYIASNERRQKILLLVALEGKVLLEQLSLRLNVPNNLIQQDLIILEKAKLLTRVKGGASDLH